MTATQPPLFPPGWQEEPCGDADERAHVDLHGPQRRRWQVETWPTVAPLNEFGRSAARPDNRLRARIQTLKAGGWL